MRKMPPPGRYEGGNESPSIRREAAELTQELSSGPGGWKNGSRSWPWGACGIARRSMTRFRSAARAAQPAAISSSARLSSGLASLSAKSRHACSHRRYSVIHRMAPSLKKAHLAQPSQRSEHARAIMRPYRGVLFCRVSWRKITSYRELTLRRCGQKPVHAPRYSNAKCLKRASAKGESAASGEQSGAFEITEVARW